jgi:hypothetical protein
MSMPGIAGAVGAPDGAGVEGAGGGCAGVWVGLDMGIPGIGGIGGALAGGVGGAGGLLGPMSIPGMLMDMFCMADMRLVSESMRNCAEVTTRSPSASPEMTG